MFLIARTLMGALYKRTAQLFTLKKLKLLSNLVYLLTVPSTCLIRFYCFILKVFAPSGPQRNKLAVSKVMIKIGVHILHGEKKYCNHGDHYLTFWHA